jgi:hypothetical protein
MPHIDDSSNGWGGRAWRLAAGLIGVRRIGFRLGPGMLRERRAAIALIACVVITTLVSVAALAVDLGNTYLTGVANQRFADSASFAGALVYSSSSSTSDMTSAVSNLATLNGLASGAASASVINSPTKDGNSAVQVTVTTSAPLYLAEVFQSTNTVSVASTAVAEIKPNAAACIIALLTSGSGITLSGGTSIDAPHCAVASNSTSTLTVPCGTSITTNTLDYNSSAAPVQDCDGGITAGTKVKALTANPLASNAIVAAAFSHVTSVASLTGPSGPTVPNGTSVTFIYGSSSTVTSALSTIGCSGTYSQPTWTVTCPAGGTYKFGTITVNGGVALNFAVSGSSSNTYDFSGAINASGSGANFGPGTYNVAGGIFTGGGSTTTFGAGTYNIGKGTISCNGSDYSICNTGSSLTFGAGTYTIAGGINNACGTLSIGAGSSANSFTIGPGSAGYAINTAGGTTTTFGNMASGTFQAVGNITTGGGSTLTISSATAHDLNGAISLSGGATLGSGTYSVAGNVALGVGGGGGTVTGSGITIVTSGSFTVTAGYSNVTFTAPTSGSLEGLVVASSGTGGATIAEGASGTSMSGVFYFPSGPVTLSGGATLGNGDGQCLELIGTRIALSGGSVVGSTCAGMSGTFFSGGSVVLVQ